MLHSLDAITVTGAAFVIVFSDLFVWWALSSDSNIHIFFDVKWDLRLIRAWRCGWMVATSCVSVRKYLSNDRMMFDIFFEFPFLSVQLYSS